MRTKLFFFLTIPFLAFSQTQVGDKINGEAAGDYSGFSVSLSSNGNIVAIGANKNDGNGDDSGHVRVYENQSGSWVQKGQDIDGETPGDEFGKVISLSSEGNIIAIGATEKSVNGTYSGQVRIYKNENGIWTQIGQDINGDNTNNRLGSSISISSDGMTVAIGAPGRNGNDVGTGYARIFRNINNVWTQLGDDLTGDNDGVRFGSGISISSDGNIVAVGAPSPGPSEPVYNYPGYIKIYKYENGDWTQIGDEITRGVVDDWLGYNLSLSGNGNIIAIGVPYKNGNYDDYTIVQVYELINDEWIQLGQQIQGSRSSSKVSLSSDGDIFAVGFGAYTRVYRIVNNVWTQIGETIQDYSCWSISLSSNANVVAIGDIFNEDNGLNSGHVVIYDLNAVLSDQIFRQDYFSIFPNPVKDILYVNLEKGLKLKQINLYNIHSQYLYSVKNKTIDTKNLKNGLYFIKVETDKGQFIKKIIVE